MHSDLRLTRREGRVAMTGRSLEQAIQEAYGGDAIAARRNAPGIAFPGIRTRGIDYTHWVDEQKSWEETCYVGDYSFTEELHVEGPDALKLFKDLSVNSFENWGHGRAKHCIQCNTDGKTISDGIIYRLGENEIIMQALPISTNDWIRYNVEKGDYDVTAQIRDTFMIGLQGPNASKVIEKVIGCRLSNYGFMHYETVEIKGRKVRALGHGMAGASGVEFQGPQEYAEEIWDAVYEAGREYGIRRLGSLAQFTARTVGSGIIVEAGDYLPAIFGEDTQEFREWLDAECYEGLLRIEGSYDADDISGWFRSPVETRRTNLIAFDHGFIGREALEEEVTNPRRSAVSLLWNDDDVADVFASMTRRDNYKFIDVPTIQRIRLVMDKVIKDGELIGSCSHPSYGFTSRKWISPATIDVGYAQPGTEVTIVWGEGGEPPGGMPHVQTTVRATVAPWPYRKLTKGQ
jgi:vanillate/3-O-methylgallate O-demethylase